MLGKGQGVVIKSERELVLMRRAGRINAIALAQTMNVVRPGATTMEIEKAAIAVLKEHKAESAFLNYPGAYPYPAITTISVNDELVHGIPGDRILVEGDIVSIDCGSVVDGFVGDSAITVGVGAISDEARRLIDVTRNALGIGIAEMVSGNHTGDVSAAIQAYVESNDFNVVREYTGHGVGRSMHEDPQVPNHGKAGSGVELRPGMTIALEPMVLSGNPATKVLEDRWTVASRDGELTAHFEHTVAVTEDGPRVLTALDPDDLDLASQVDYNQYFVGMARRVEGSAGL